MGGPWPGGFGSFPVTIAGVSKSPESPFEASSSGFPPSYDWVTGGAGRDELGTVITEVTTFTTHTSYRVWNA